MVPKADLIGAIESLQALGLGSYIIARLLGYSPKYVKQLCELMTVKRGVHPELVILSLLPDSLRATCVSIRANSERAYAIRDRSLPMTKVPRQQVL